MVVREVMHVLTHRIGCSLIPLRICRALLCGKDFHKAPRERIEVKGLKNMSMQRRRVKLREHVNFVVPRIDAVADWDIDQTKLTGQRNRRLASHLSEGIQPRPSPATHNNHKHPW